ncbi:hypothetical protein SFRURICE_020177 [Spodoptera frugiperda]|nr:hypothetical protein SFRURICE_020177 [Spodoptera frugiperda]
MCDPQIVVSDLGVMDMYVNLYVCKWIHDTGEKPRELLAARPDLDPCVRRVAFRACLKEPSDHHRWGSVGQMPDPELRTI